MSANERRAKVRVTVRAWMRERKRVREKYKLANFSMFKETEK